MPPVSRHAPPGETARAGLAEATPAWSQRFLASGIVPQNSSTRFRCDNAAAPGRRQPGWHAGEGTPVFTPAPPRTAGRERVTPTAKKRGDGLEPRPLVGTRWPPASARRIRKWRCGAPQRVTPTAKKRGDGLEPRPLVGTRWPPASARRIRKWRCGAPLRTYAHRKNWPEVGLPDPRAVVSERLSGSAGEQTDEDRGEWRNQQEPDEADLALQHRHIGRHGQFSPHPAKVRRNGPEFRLWE